MALIPSEGDIVATQVRPGFLLLAVLFLFFAIRTVYWVWVYPFFVSPLRHLPKPKRMVSPILGQLPRFLEVAWVPHLFHEWSLETAGGPFIRYLGLGNAESLIVSSVTAYREVLQTKSAAFMKPSLTRRCAAVVIGDGLPFAEGHVHRHRRGVLNKFFSVPAIKTFMPTLAGKARSLVHAMRAQRDFTGEVEVESLIWKTVLDVIGIKVLGLDLNHIGSSLPSDLHTLFTRTMQQSLASHIIHYLSSYLPLRHLLPAKSNRQFLDDCDQIRSTIRNHVATREQGVKIRAENGAMPDMIQTMLNANMSHDEVVEYVLNMLVLGHDTTACSLVWAVHCLAQNIECQEQMRSEVWSIVDGLDEPTYAQIESMKYLDNFLKEVLRLYCPVAYIPRETIEEVEVAGVTLPKGTVVQLCPAVINLNPRIWGSDASTFNPDRWENLTGEAKNAYAFQTFHNGPRICIGKHLSMVEMKLMLVQLITRYRVEPAAGAGEVTEFASPSFTLRPKEKLRVKLIEL